MTRAFIERLPSGERARRRAPGKFVARKSIREARAAIEGGNIRFDLHIVWDWVPHSELA